MIFSKDGYAIEHYPNRNQIVITMPQTAQTLTNTASVVLNRKVDFTESDLTLLLNVTRCLCEAHQQKEETK